METVSKMCPFRTGQYCLALLNSPQEEAYEHLFGGLLFTYVEIQIKQDRQTDNPAEI